MKVNFISVWHFVADLIAKISHQLYRRCGRGPDFRLRAVFYYEK